MPMAVVQQLNDTVAFLWLVPSLLVGVVVLLRFTVLD